MRCSEAKRRLTKYWADSLERIDDAELLSHLQQCSSCCRHAAAVRSLSRDFAAARGHDLKGGLPLAFLKTRVEAQLASAPDTEMTKEKRVMATVIDSLKRRSRLSATVAVIAVVVAFLTLVPFTFERTVGYEVAVAGVDKQLATDQYRVQQLLTALGLEEAEVDVTGCQATCSLVVRQLRSEQDAQLVKTAFASDGKRVFDCEVIEVVGEQSGSLLGQVKLNLSHKVMVRATTGSNDATLNEVLVQRLGEGCGGNAFTWLEQLTDSTVAVQTTICTHEDSIVMLKQPICIPVGIGEGAGLGPDALVQHLTLNDSTVKIAFVQCGEGPIEEVCRKIQAIGGELTDDMIQELEDLGCQVSVEYSEDGTTRMIQIKCGDAETAATVADEGDAAAKAADAEVPADFVLEQNYPNPFNPITDIGFSLPQSQHVTLEVFNVQGQKVRTLVDGSLDAGQHTVQWDATNGAGDRVASGVYFYRLTAGDFTASKKMTLVK